MTFDYFFAKEWEAPEEYLWELYSPGHLMWLGAMAIICAIFLRYFLKLPAEKQDKYIKGLAIWIGVQEILKDIIHWATDTLGAEHLPLHICGISIFFTLIYAFKPGRLTGAYLYGMSMPGALCALIFANWTGYPFLNFSSINSFTIHGELILFVLMVLLSGRLYPDIRKIPQLTLVMVGLAIPMHFVNKALSTNFMFISYPSPGSPLMPLYDLFGDFYVVAALVLMVAIWVILFLPWYIKEKRTPKK